MIRIGRTVSTLCLALLMGPLALEAQSAVAGRVVDAESRAGIAGATVEVLGVGQGVTGDNGQFRVAAQPGTYSVVVRQIGYADRRVDGVDVDAGGATSLVIDLSATAFVLNPVVVTAGRREEKRLESPASISVVGAEVVRQRVAPTPAQHIQATPGVDMTQTGLSQSNVVTRGFNNVFSGAALVMTDNRYARVPSIRFNAWNFIPINNLDIDRIEVLLGPASALYGPNSASGVVHLITSSPFQTPGTTATIAGGEREVFQAQFRHASIFSDQIALKVSGQYFQGRDWLFRDPAELAAQQDNPDDPLIGLRDFDQQRWGGEARLDIRPWVDGGEIVLNAGFNQAASSIELTGLGAGQADDWRYSFFQARVARGGFFGQFFLNASDAGDTYLLRTGDPIVDQSKLFATQGQYSFDVGDRQEFIVGVDAQFTRPDTDGTITGRNEDDDAINEIGGYLHSSTALGDRVELVAALRVDDHNRLPDLNLSPRAALLFTPRENQAFRVSYNRAFSTPTTNNLFLDLVVQETALLNVRTMGVPEEGFTFPMDAGGPQYVSQFAPGNLLPSGTVNPVWPGFVQFLGQALQDPGFASQLPPPFNALPPAQLQALLGLVPGSLQSPVAWDLKTLNLTTTEFDPANQLEDVARLEATITNTIEVGYKGLLGDRVLLAADVYRSAITDFVGPLRVETPTVHANVPALTADLTAQLSADPVAVATLAQLGLNPQQFAGLFSQFVNTVPLGVVAPEGFGLLAPNEAIVTYRNFGDVTLWGADISAQILLGDITLGASYSLVSSDCLDANEDGEEDCGTALDIALNAPANKGSAFVRFSDKGAGFTVEGRARFKQGFPMNSGAYIGEVEGFALLDLTTQYQLPFYPQATVGLTVTNLLNDRTRQFIGAPKLGRLALLQLQMSM